MLVTDREGPIRKHVSGPSGKYVVETDGHEGIEVAYHSDLPAGSGLGTSATLNVVWLSLIKAHVPTDEDRKTIAELSYDLERILGILGGKQDQYASALGGFNYFHFTETVSAERLAISPQMIDALESRLVLCYTGKPRLSSNIHQDVWGNYRHGNPDTVNALYSLRNVAGRMRAVLLEGDVDEVGELLNQNWRHQRALHPSITNPQIDSFFECAMANGAVAGKACGAGGGGCLLFLAAPERKTELATALRGKGARVIPFHFEFDGLRVQIEEE
jgi:D-glycero-alpha-D-manno-heptose-7-phosphate kinase